MHIYRVSVILVKLYTTVYKQFVFWRYNENIL